MHRSSAETTLFPCGPPAEARKSSVLLQNLPVMVCTCGFRVREMYHFHMWLEGFRRKGKGEAIPGWKFMDPFIFFFPTALDSE